MQTIVVNSCTVYQLFSALEIAIFTIFMSLEGSESNTNSKRLKTSSTYMLPKQAYDNVAGSGVRRYLLTISYHVRNKWLVQWLILRLRFSLPSSNCTCRYCSGCHWWFDVEQMPKFLCSISFLPVKGYCCALSREFCFVKCFLRFHQMLATYLITWLHIKSNQSNLR